MAADLLAHSEKGRVAAEQMKIVDLLLAAGDRKDAGARDVGHGLPHPLRVRRIVDRSRQAGRAAAQTPPGGRQKQDIAIR
ncbi:hypothetical protein RFM99_11580 [Mesorhizobium sp. VK4C]|uniref:hypothetical protein n=1 Tax=Mesorhizobium captivum TaxID=3072319 RepID=UPI002A23D18F|nr:hypothetical protein [Mesorhizobium sp. VK4C]MDX8499058.1 hypothetical protein [Mesorhizobium sp. VK4C]